MRSVCVSMISLVIKFITPASVSMDIVTAVMIFFRGNQVALNVSRAGGIYNLVLLSLTNEYCRRNSTS